MNNPNCRYCKMPLDHQAKFVAYYANGKTVYHDRCTECERLRWKDPDEFKRRIRESNRKNTT